MKKFKTAYKTTELQPFDQPDWRDFYRLPWSLLVALFYMFPKSIWMKVRGKEIEHEEEEPLDPTPGWKPFFQHDQLRIDRHYFYAEKEFDDFHWHTIDGYQLRATPEIPELTKLYFVRNSFYEFDHGLIAQAIHVDGNRNNCPLVYVDYIEKTIEFIQKLDKVYLLEFEAVEKELLIKGKASEDGFSLTLKNVNTLRITDERI